MIDDPATISLRSIELDVPDPVASAGFLVSPWGATAAGASGDARFVGGSGPYPYLVGLYPATARAVRSISFVAGADRIEAIAGRAADAGLTVERTPVRDPGGGDGTTVVLPEGERFRFISGAEGVSPGGGDDAPVKLTHVVVNAADAERSAAVCEEVLGFTVSDRTRGMVFVRCNRSHHSIAFARAGYSSLNHIAFEMRDVDAVMRGIGRMRDADAAPSWGPGRHGPGANVFAYFVAPFGAVVEYSTAVEQVDEHYRTGAPEDWTWPPNRIDQWGLSDKDVAALTAAERRFRFAPAMADA
ncbi:VOC family protein [Sphingomonas sp.]|jgi:catechol 2,3-dioxygenase-like lactoylglutathione lyase family enzyme|uniref:VOC family protein n=1 Tax=Sphingomonas sp. TaxID=28214 RepID=UPI002D7ED26E|nr:VOC family protein [Sphingomonas sp.]HEU0045403.1 VOC family protein [Sphingomonas sp.]